MKFKSKVKFNNNIVEALGMSSTVGFSGEKNVHTLKHLSAILWLQVTDRVMSFRGSVSRVSLYRFLDVLLIIKFLPLNWIRNDSFTLFGAERRFHLFMADIN